MKSVARRRILIAAAALVAGPALGARSPGEPVRVGLLIEAREDVNVELWAGFAERLAELGYVEGRNLVIDRRFARGARERLLALAAELVALRPDAIVAGTTASVRAAMKASASIPIVMTGTADPVGTGLVRSLARPGGNVTGSAHPTPELSAKWIEALRLLAPGARQLGFLGQSGNSAILGVHRALQAVAQQLGLSVSLFDAVAATDVDAAFETMARERFGGLMVASTSVLLPRRDQIVERATRARLPAVYARPEYVLAGGLMSYAPDRNELFRRAADYVHRILQGASPAELPVEQASRFELTLNLKAAKAIGLTLPQSLLVRADRVIE